MLVQVNNNRSRIEDRCSEIQLIVKMFQFDNIEKSLYQEKEKKKPAQLTRDVSRNLIEEAMVRHASMY